MQAKKKKVASLALWGAAFTAGYFGYNYSQDSQFARAQEQREEIREGLSHAENLASTFRRVGKVVEPSVVNISVTKKSVARPQIDEDALRRFFPDRDGDGEPDLPRGFNPDQFEDRGGEFGMQGTGSGVIIEVDGKKGYIVTNNHVAGGAESLLITLADGREIRNGKVLGADPKTDLAVIEVEAERLSPAKWGNSDELQKGDWIMAFGSPFGYVGSMTHGIVSALNRQAGILGSQGYENFIQVDAPINPGNSGGPLVNLKSEVVGINTAIASRSGGFQGVGFTIPSNQAKMIYQQLKEKGKVTRGWLGVSIRDVAGEVEIARSFEYEGDKGVLVFDVIKGTPATGKLRRGDIITQINGKKAETVQQLRNQIALMPPNTDVKMTVFRGGREQQVTIRLGEQPEDVLAVRTPGRGDAEPTKAPANANAEKLGITVQTLTEELAEKQGLETKAGVVVATVNRTSPAAREGLRPGDVITEVGNKEVKSAEEFADAMSDVDMKKGVRLYVVTPQGSRYVFISTEREQR